MVICHIITTLGIGGAEKLLLYLTKEQAKKHQIHIIYFKKYDEIVAQFPQNIKIYNIPLNIYAFYRLRKLIISIRPDVLHTHLGHADWFGWIAAINLSIKKITTIHSTGFKWNKADIFISFFYRFFLNTIASKVKIISISKAVDEFVRTNFKMPSSRRFIVYNATPDIDKSKLPDKDYIRHKLNINKTDFVVSFVGRLQYPKSVHTLIDAMAEVKKIDTTIKCIIVGDGNLRSSLELQAKNNSLENDIKFLGSQDKPEIFISSSDVLVLTSTYEGFGMVVIEAFRLGIPVITTNIPSLKEIITPYQNGLLFTPENANELAQKIFEMKNTKEKYLQMCKNARSTFIENYEIQKYANELEKIYEE